MEKFKENGYHRIVIACAVVYMSYRLIKYCNKRKWMFAKVNNKQKQVKGDKKVLEHSLVSSSKVLLDEHKKKIVELPISQLLQELQSGNLSCVSVLKAYQSKALEVTKELNCVTEFIKEAEDWAKALDEQGALGKKGPLHGLPFSVKDNVCITGYDCTVGLSRFIDRPVSECAPIVLALKSLGAIPFCKTNIPQTMLSFGCSNPIWGLTKNPWSTERTPGGSSGGEGSLIGAGGSPFGIGSDVGGSARFPAAFCGVYSIKYQSFRMSYKGFRRSAVGCVGINSVPGILGRDVETVTLVSKLLLDNSYIRSIFDPDVLPIPWNELMFSAVGKKLKIGYYEDDGFFPTTPGIRRAVQMSRRLLEEQGHELIAFSPPRVAQVVNAVVSILGADQGKYLIEALSVDDIDPVLKVTMLGVRMPYTLKRLIQPIISRLSPRLFPVFTAGGGYRLRSTHQLWSEITQLNEYKAEFLAGWRKLGLDLCIAPCFACPAPLSKDVGRLVPAFSYACLYNYLDLPVGIVPITKENEEDQLKLETEYHHNDLICKLIKKTTKGAIGLPIALQVVGLPYTEELVLRGMQILDSAVKQ